MSPSDVVSIKNLSKVFRKTPILNHLSLSVAEGEVFGIVGRSGAGKTTLIHCLTGLEKPSEGEVWVDGEPIFRLRGAPLRLARRKIGMVFQQFHLFSSRTALENVRYPLEIAGVDADPHHFLALVGLQGKEPLYPAQLSGGQRQRVAIARALALGPKLLLCDEPTSALDPETTGSILKLLSKINRELGVTIVIITHEMEVVRQICHRVAVLDQGSIIEEGRSLDLFAHPSHPTTKRLLARASHAIPPDLLPGGQGKLLNLCFPSGLAERGLISQMLRKFPVEVNILLGSIDVLLEGRIGHLVIELTGQTQDTLAAIDFLRKLGVYVEEVNR